MVSGHVDYPNGSSALVGGNSRGGALWEVDFLVDFKNRIPCRDSQMAKLSSSP